MNKVNLDIFEGPLDLLLYLIKKEDIDINDIPVSKLLHEYIQYIEFAKELDIDLAGEFLEMAAELAYIKSKMLLPESQPDEDEGPDPRQDLVNKLLEYQKFKLAAGDLNQRLVLGRDVFKHAPFEIEEVEDGPLVEADMEALLVAFQNVLKRLPQEKIHEIRGKVVGTAERVVQLTEILRDKTQVAFEDLFEGDAAKPQVVVTFLAILEMGKQSFIQILQDRVFGRIVIMSRLANPDNPAIDMSEIPVSEMEDVQ